jgi:flagellar biosynthetic protein FliP
VQLIALMTVLSLAPSIIVMTTSFVRIVVVLSLLRTATGLQQSPPNAVLISLAIFMSAFIMAPVFTQSYEEGIVPLLEEEIELTEAFTLSTGPLKTFMLQQTREEDLALFVDMSPEPLAETPEATSFWIIDLVVASILMSMGMMMLPPVVISLPFKLIFFVLVDGWNLVIGALMRSFGTLG